MALKSLIKQIEVIPIKIPLKREYKGSHYSMTHRCTVITRVITEDGIVGEIYNGDEHETQPAVVDMILNRMAPLVIGKNIFATNEIWETLWPFTFDILADRKIALNAMACIDSAVYDAVGKTLNMPLYRLWGGARDALPVMVIGGYYTEGKDVDEEAIRRDIETFKAMGAAGCKFKVGGRSPQVDAERVRIARQTAGDDFVLAVDANQGWTRLEALQFSERVRDLNLRWFEEPCRWSVDREAMRDVRMMAGIPVNAGQSEVSAAGCIGLMTAGAIDVCNFDASWGGGPTAWRQVAAAAAALGFEMAHHEEPQISAHLLASAPTGTFLEVFHPDRDPLFYEIVEERNPFVNGYYKVPDGPGFGIRLNREVIEKYRVDR
jgi:L-alanine-DL-glutamate epimerase-like enolase superfamily enzyme